LLAELAPTQANRTHSFLNQLFIKAANIGWIELHPMYGLNKPNPEGQRDRVEVSLQHN
jgi:hypothetical protein